MTSSQEQRFQAELIEQVAKAHEEEREKLARDIHDALIQMVAACRFRLQTVKIFVQQRKNLDQAVEEIKVIDQVLEQGLERLRQLIFDLTPPVIEEEGLPEAIRISLKQFEDLTGIKCTFRVSGPLPERLTEQAEKTVWCAIQEALWNAYKHAKTPRIEVRASVKNGNLLVTVRDWGRGFDVEEVKRRPPSKEGGFGLRSMEARVRSVGGRMTIWSRPGRGTRISLVIPILRPPSKEEGRRHGLSED